MHNNDRVVRTLEELYKLYGQPYGVGILSIEHADYLAQDLASNSLVIAGTTFASFQHWRTNPPQSSSLWTAEALGLPSSVPLPSETEFAHTFMRIARRKDLAARWGNGYLIGSSVVVPIEEQDYLATGWAWLPVKGRPNTEANNALQITYDGLQALLETSRRMVGNIPEIYSNLSKSIFDAPHPDTWFLSNTFRPGIFLSMDIEDDATDVKGHCTTVTYMVEEQEVVDPRRHNFFDRPTNILRSLEEGLRNLPSERS